MSETKTMYVLRPSPVPTQTQIHLFLYKHGFISVSRSPEWAVYRRKGSFEEVSVPRLVDDPRHGTHIMFSVNELVEFLKRPAHEIVDGMLAQ